MRICQWALLGLAHLLAIFAAHAQPVTSLWYEVVPGPTGAGTAVTRFYQAPTDQFTWVSALPGDLRLRVNYPLGDFIDLRFLSPVGQALAIGAHENVDPRRSSDRPQAEVLEFYGANVGCSLESGRFVILELELDSAGQPTRLAADFEGRCEAGIVVYGELRYGSAVPLTADKAATASAPDAFAFRPRQGVLPGSLVISDATTLYGMRSPATISIIGGEYSLNGGPFTSQNGIAAHRDRVTVRVVAAASHGTTTGIRLTAGGVSADFSVTTFTPGAPFTAAVLQSQTPQNAPGNGFLDARPPAWSIATYRERSRPGHLQVRVAGANSRFFYLDFGAAPGAVLLPGPYELAHSIPSGASPTLNALGSDIGCAAFTGRFVIHELALNGDDSVSTFAASFELLCAAGAPVYGEVRINSTLPLPSMVSSADSLPDPFALQAQMPVKAGTVVHSNWISVMGVNVPVPVSIAGGMYSLNGAPFTPAPGTARLHDEIVVQVVAPRLPGAARGATLTIGGRSATLHVRTYEPGSALTGLYFRSASGDYVGQGQTRLFLAPPNIVEIFRYDWGPVTAGITGVAGSTWQTMLVGAGNTVVVPGTYEGAGRSATSTAPGLDVSGNGRGCNQTAGRFVVHEAVYASDGTPQRFAADFEQHCEVSGPPLFGELRFNSTIPFAALVGGTCIAGEPECAAPLSNISTRGQVLTGNDVMIGGFVVGGSVGKTVVVRARGPSLAAFGITNPLANPQLHLNRSSDQALIASNNNWGSADNAAAISASGFAPSDPLEAAILIYLAPGAYTAIISGALGGTGVGIVEVFEVDHSEVPLANISTRGQVRTGNDVLIGGFVVQGSGPQTVVVRARGPSLAPFGISNALANPTLQLVRSSDQVVIAFNDDWGTAANASDVTASGFAPSNALESAMLVTLPPGAYTAIVSGVAGATGVGIVEVFPLP